MIRFKIEVNENAHLVTVDESNPHNVLEFPNHDKGQLIEMYRKQGFRHVREDDTDWLVREDDWEAINEVVEDEMVRNAQSQLNEVPDLIEKLVYNPHKGEDNVAYRKGEDA